VYLTGIVTEALVTPADNKATCARYFEEVFGKANFDIIDTLVAPDVVSHNPWPGQRPGAAGVKDTLMLFRRTFPDLAIEMVHMLADGDKVLAYIVVRGTHRGELMGVAPTGNKIEYEEAIVLRLANGKIVEHWAVADAMALMQQIGAIPS
jgi:predicted ester cyclase